MLLDGTNVKKKLINITIHGNNQRKPRYSYKYIS